MLYIYSDSVPDETKREKNNREKLQAAGMDRLENVVMTTCLNLSIPADRYVRAGMMTLPVELNFIACPDNLHSLIQTFAPGG